METETQQSNGESQAGIEPVGEPDIQGGEPQQQETSDGQQQPPDGQQQPGQDVPRRPTRAERREDYRRNLELNKALEAMTSQNRELNDRLREMSSRIAESVEASRPPREDPFVAKKKELDTRYQKVLARLDRDPSAVDDFRDLQVEYGRLGAQMEKAQEKPAPRGPSPLAQSLSAEFPWAHPDSRDEDARAMLNGYAAKLARTEKRNMSDPNVLYTTLRQAAAMVAKDLGYPLPASFSTVGDSNGRDRYSGSSGRGGVGTNGSPDYTGMEPDIEAAATVMYPNLDKGAAVQKWKSTVGKSLASMRK